MTVGACTLIICVSVLFFTFRYYNE